MYSIYMQKLHRTQFPHCGTNKGSLKLYFIFKYKLGSPLTFYICIIRNIQTPTFLLKTEKAWPQALQTTLGLPKVVGGYVEYPALGANLKGPAPAPKPGCWPLTAPVPITSFSKPQHEAHMDDAPA